MDGLGRHDMVFYYSIEVFLIWKEMNGMGPRLKKVLSISHSIQSNPVQSCLVELLSAPCHEVQGNGMFNVHANELALGLFAVVPYGFHLM